MDKYAKVRERAMEYFNGGYNCCEAVVLTVCDHLGIDKDLPLKVATPFGSGMSRNGSNCGALNAAFICIGMVKGRTSSEDSRDNAYLPADKLFNSFKEKYGSTYCADITGINLRDPEEAARNKERMHRDLCGPIVQQVSCWLIDELEK